MFCHGPVCARLISGRRSGHDAVVSHRASGQSSGSSATPSSASAFPSELVSFHPSRCPVPPSGGPIFARIACARLRAFRAGAHIAHLIARTREANAGRTSPVRSVGFFSRRREAGDEAASGCRFLLCHSTTDLQRSSRSGNYFLLYEQAATGQKRRVKLSGPWAPLQSIRSVPEVRPPTPLPSSRSRLRRVRWRRVRGIPARRHGGRA